MTETEEKAGFPRQFDIWLARVPLTESPSLERHEIRPILIVSNNKANQFSNTLTVVPITTRQKKPLPTHVQLFVPGRRMTKSTALCENLQSLHRRYLINRMGIIEKEAQERLKKALLVQLDIRSV